MKKKELVPFDYIRQEIGKSAFKIGEKVGLGNTIDVSFFTFGQVIYENDKVQFEKWISLIKQGVRSARKQRNKLNKRKVG